MQLWCKWVHALFPSVCFLPACLGPMELDKFLGLCSLGGPAPAQRFSISPSSQGHLDIMCMHHAKLLCLPSGNSAHPRNLQGCGVRSAPSNLPTTFPFRQRSTHAVLTCAAPTTPYSASLPPCIFTHVRTMLLEFAALLALIAALATVAANTRHTLREREQAKIAYTVGRCKCNGRRPSRNEVLNHAVPWYRSHMPYYPGSNEALRQFILRWGRDVRPVLTDLHRSVQRSLMSDAECKQCIEEIRAGYYKGDVLFGFSSLDHAANHRRTDGRFSCPMVHDCRKRYQGRNSHGMMDRLRAFDPKLTHFKATPSDPLTPELMARRVCEARILLSQGLERRKRTFYLDAKTLLVCPTSHQVIGYKEDMEKYGHPPVGGARWKGVVTEQKGLIKIQFYCMVNWHGGVCGFWVCQGSTGVADVFEVG